MFLGAYSRRQLNLPWFAEHAKRSEPLLRILFSLELFAGGLLEPAVLGFSGGLAEVAEVEFLNLSGDHVGNNFGSIKSMEINMNLNFKKKRRVPVLSEF